MTGALPDPILLIAVTLGLIAAFTLNEIRHRVMTRWRRNAKTPVPGGAPPIAPPTPGREGPIRPAPAPGHHYGHLECVAYHHHDGQLDCVTKDWQCGCRHYFDAAMCLAHVEPCQPERPDALDLEYEAECAKAEEEQ
jgi:hypothetical protein